MFEGVKLPPYDDDFKLKSEDVLKNHGLLPHSMQNYKAFFIPLNTNILEGSNYDYQNACVPQQHWYFYSRQGFDLGHLAQLRWD